MRADSEMLVKRLRPDAALPARTDPGAAGYDVRAAEAFVVPARGKALVPTGLAATAPEGTYIRVAPRSGLAWKHSIDVGAGVVDRSYTGEINVVLFNLSEVSFRGDKGDRIAQLIVERIETPAIVETDEIAETQRGSGGFGSTGLE
nr:dUTP pyrophosphatase [Oceanusvirus sp.]